MNFQSADFQRLVDAGKRVMAPWAQWNALSARTLERGARFHYNVAGDWLELGVAQLQAASGAKDFGALLNQQAALVNAFAEKSTARSQEALQLATDTQGEYAAWASATASELARKTP